MAPGKHAGGAGFITADLDAKIQKPGTTGQRFVRAGLRGNQSDSLMQF